MPAIRLIKDIPEQERPREKIGKLGARSLSDAELLAVFFSTGRAGASAIDLGLELIARYGSLRNLSRADVAELQSIKGIGPAKSAQLAAVFEFGQRLAAEVYQKKSIGGPQDVYDLMGLEMNALPQESVRTLLLNHRKELIKAVEIYRGTKNECFAQPAEILKPAIVHAAASLILIHNHPTGDPSPSSADIQATRKLYKACESLGIGLDDHVIIGAAGPAGACGYFSFREGGLL